MTSGAGQDAQMMARICPTAMIFCAEHQGHQPQPEGAHPDEDCVAGANVFLDVVSEMRREYSRSKILTRCRGQELWLHPEDHPTTLSGESEVDGLELIAVLYVLGIGIAICSYRP